MVNTKDVLLKDKEWSSIDGELCLVKNFLPEENNLVKDDIVTSPDISKPYASIILDTVGVENVTGFITHKIDFTNLWKAFKERTINNEREEVLIYWTAKHYKYKFYQIISNFLLKVIGVTPMPKLIVMVCPKGTYKSCPNFKLDTDKQVLVFVYGLLSKNFWIPEVIR